MSAVMDLPGLGPDWATAPEAGSSTASKGTDSASETAPLKDKLKNLSKEDMDKLIDMLAKTLMKLMPIGDIGDNKGADGAADGGGGGGGCPGGNCAPPPAPVQPSGGCSGGGGGGCSAGGGGGGGGCNGGGAGGSQGVDGVGPGTPGRPDTPGHKPWDDFSQTSAGNCASIAVIKAGMDKYGDKMYQSKKPNSEGGFDLVLQNGKNVSLSGADLALAQKEAKFKGNPESQGYKDGVLAYAAIAKGKAAAKGESYGTALASLGNGEFIPNVSHYLGMKVNKVDAAEASHANSAIKTDAGHALSLDHGATDVFGRRVAFGQDGFNRGSVNYFELA